MLLIQDETLGNELIKQRRSLGHDRYDEVWDGVYVMSPLANNEHQGLVGDLYSALGEGVDLKRLGQTLPGANVSDRHDDWTKNYRVPDVLVFRPQTSAIDRETHWLGGPELAIEITCPGERVLDKLDFYAATSTKEMLVIDRKPWRLTMYRWSTDQKMEPAGESMFGSEMGILGSDQFPLGFAVVDDPSVLRISDPSGETTRDIAIRR